MPNSFTQWMDDKPQATGTSPYIGPQPLIRDALDAKRMAWRQTPEASYPDGYLGTVNSRREDRLSNAIWRQQRSYQRGVHKGERIDMSDYLWPEEFNLWSGLEAEARGERFTSPAYGAMVPVLNNDGKPGPLNNMSAVPDPNRAAQLRAMGPAWT